MAVGLPVVAPAVGGNVEVVEHGGNGFLIGPRDASAILDRVMEICRNPALRHKMSSRSREIVEERFSQRAVYSELERVYSMLLQAD